MDVIIHDTAEDTARASTWNYRQENENSRVAFAKRLGNLRWAVNTKCMAAIQRTKHIVEFLVTL